MRIGVLELLAILAIIFFAFGPKQIPKLTASLLDSFNSFKKGMKSKKNDNNEENTKSES